MNGPGMITATAGFCAAIVTITAAAMLAARYYFGVVIVRGRSMTPTLQDGEKVLTRRVRGDRVRPGDIVVIRVPGAGPDGAPSRYRAVKRVAATGGDPLPPSLRPPAGVGRERLPPGQLAVLGDNPPASVDSREWGPVPAASVLAKVIRTL